jgi:hypothetical protein
MAGNRYAMKRILYLLFATLPALFWLVLLAEDYGSYYYWRIYRLAALFLVAFCLVQGLVSAVFLRPLWSRRPGGWLFLTGSLAWLAALAFMGLLHLTPLCVGQNNGDGNNDLARCMVVDLLVSLVYSPVHGTILALVSLAASRVLKTRRKWIR